MSLAVHTARKTADDDETGACELAPERACHLGAVRRARPRADHRHGRSLEERVVARAAQEESRRRVEDRGERAREPTSRARQPAQAAPLEVGEIGHLVEGACEPLEAPVARLGDDVTVGLGGERRERELPHVRSRSRGAR